MSKLPVLSPPLCAILTQSCFHIIEEGFCDRGYAPNGQLLPRHHPYGVINDGKVAAEQALNIAKYQRVYSESGFIPVRASSLCIHGDQAGALFVAKAVRKALEEAGFVVRGR
jgi:5-oxoprolinase (ATP-hydrolysing) subunit A